MTINLKQTDHVKTFGHSMYPILHSGDIVYYKDVPFKNIQLNDIIVAKLKDHYVTHRVLHKHSTHLITKGDNLQKIDNPISPTQIVGVVYKVKRANIEFHPDTYYLLQSSIYYDHIKKLVTMLDSKHIPYILLKGLPLHLKYSKNHPRRKFFDVDILIRHTDRMNVLKELAKLGFSRRVDFLSSTHEKLMDKPIEETYMKKFDGFAISVDVHYEAVFMMTQIGTLNELYHQQYIDAFSKELFFNTQPYRSQSLSCTILRDDYLLVYLALHFFHHNFKGIHRLQLIQKIIDSVPERKKTLFWQQVSEIISRFSMEGYIYGTFLSVNKYFPETKIPAGFLEKITPSPTQCNYLKNYFIDENIYEETGSIKTGILLFMNLYLLSYNPWYKKFPVFFRPAVLYMILWIMYFGLTSKLAFFKKS